MPKLIVADENEGRRALLANTFERNGFDVTRVGTLRQAEGTALATMPEVVLVEGDWKVGDAIDSAQRMMSDPEFAFKCRIVVLAKSPTDDYLVSAANAGISEVMKKPIDMNALISQIQKHAQKQFVPPPAQVSTNSSISTGSFGVESVMGGGTWALPMLSGLVSKQTVNQEFISEIFEQLGEEGKEFDTEAMGIQPQLMSEMLRVALNKLVSDGESNEVNSEATEQAKTTSMPNFKEISKGKTLGASSNSPESTGSINLGSSMEDILQRQADEIAMEIEAKMDEILDEKPEFITLVEDFNRVPIDVEMAKMTKHTADFVHELLWDLGRPGAVSDITLMTRIEDATEMMQDILDGFSFVEEE